MDVRYILFIQCSPSMCLHGMEGLDLGLLVARLTALPTDNNYHYMCIDLHTKLH